MKVLAAKTHVLFFHPVYFLSESTRVACEVFKRFKVFTGRQVQRPKKIKSYSRAKSAFANHSLVIFHVLFSKSTHHLICLEPAFRPRCISFPAFIFVSLRVTFYLSFFFSSPISPRSRVCRSFFCEPRKITTRNYSGCNRGSKK